jgi:hypothetical protein
MMAERSDYDVGFRRRSRPGRAAVGWQPPGAGAGRPCWRNAAAYDIGFGGRSRPDGLRSAAGRPVQGPGGRAGLTLRL